LHRQQPEKDKQNFDVSPPRKKSADADGYTDFDSSVIKRGAVWFNTFKSLKTLNAKVVSFLNVYSKRSNQKALSF